ncbi:hypothetical protein D3C85_1679930 [compost metagenome]
MRNQLRNSSRPSHSAAKARASLIGALLRRRDLAQSQAGRAKKKATPALKPVTRKAASGPEAPPKSWML